ncbi:MAG: hypothetical protein ACYDCN_05450 [Bacteroidia bacterium]
MEIIRMIERHIELIKVVSLILGGSFALWQYSKQQRFKRLQNLSSILQKFFDNDDLLTLFSLFNAGNYADVQRTPPKIKYKFLALLEEVALYTEKFEVDKQHAIYLFQWHFRFVFTEEKTRKAFWYNLVSNANLTEDEINTKATAEMNAAGWLKQKKLAQECEKRKDNT